MLALEILERRNAPAASLNLTGGVLTVIGDKDGSVVREQIVQTNKGSFVEVLLDGNYTYFPAASVQSAVVYGGAGRNDIDLLGLPRPATIFGGDAGNSIQGSSGDTTIYGGRGQDDVYDILGRNTIDLRQGVPGPQAFKADTVYTNAQSTVFSQRNDVVIQLFAANRLPSSGTVVVERGVLYITPGDAGSYSYLETLVGGQQYQITYDFHDGAGVQVRQFSTKDFQAVGFFGGNGNDFYQNDTNRGEVAYGQGGDDTLIGSIGSYVNLLKGGSGNDYLEGRGNDGVSPNDLSGNAGADVLVLNAAVTRPATFRVDALDVIFGARPKVDVVIGRR